MDGGAWWAAVCGVAQSRTRLKRRSSSSSSSSSVIMLHYHISTETDWSKPSKKLALASPFSIIDALENISWDFRVHHYSSTQSLKNSS